MELWADLRENCLPVYSCAENGITLDHLFPSMEGMWGYNGPKVDKVAFSRSYMQDLSMPWPTQRDATQEMSPKGTLHVTWYEWNGVEWGSSDPDPIL